MENGIWPNCISRINKIHKKKIKNITTLALIPICSPISMKQFLVTIELGSGGKKVIRHPQPVKQ